MNIIQQLFDHYVRWIAGWQPQSASLAVHAALIVALPTVACLAAFRAGSRTTGLQFFSFGVGVLLAASLNVERCLPKAPVALTWMVTISLMIVAILPGALAFFMVRERGQQQLLRRVFYILLASLFLANLFQKGGR